MARRQPEAADDLYVQAMTRIMDAFSETRTCAVDPDHGPGMWMLVSPNADVTDLCSLGCVREWAAMQGGKRE